MIHDFPDPMPITIILIKMIYQHILHKISNKSYLLYNKCNSYTNSCSLTFLFTISTHNYGNCFPDHENLFFSHETIRPFKMKISRGHAHQLRTYIQAFQRLVQLQLQTGSTVKFQTLGHALGEWSLTSYCARVPRIRCNHSNIVIVCFCFIIATSISLTWFCPVYFCLSFCFLSFYLSLPPPKLPFFNDSSVLQNTHCLVNQ